MCPFKCPYFWLHASSLPHDIYVCISTLFRGPQARCFLVKIIDRTRKQNFEPSYWSLSRELHNKEIVFPTTAWLKGFRRWFFLKSFCVSSKITKMAHSEKRRRADFLWRSHETSDLGSYERFRLNISRLFASTDLLPVAENLNKWLPLA